MRTSPRPENGAAGTAHGPQRAAGRAGPRSPRSPRRQAFEVRASVQQAPTSMSGGRCATGLRCTHRRLCLGRPLPAAAALSAGSAAPTTPTPAAALPGALAASWPLPPRLGSGVGRAKGGARGGARSQSRGRAAPPRSYRRAGPAPCPPAPPPAGLGLGLSPDPSDAPHPRATGTKKPPPRRAEDRGLGLKHSWEGMRQKMAT